MAGPSSLVDITLSARKLADRDTFSKSDPVCIVYRGTADGYGAEREIGRTETVWNSLSPTWSTKIRTEYFFEQKQNIVFRLYDIDTKSGVLDDQDFLGATCSELADIVAAPNGYLSLKLSGANYVKGELIVHAEEVDQGQRQVMEFKIQGVQLSKKSLWTKPDVFLEFYRFLPDGSRQLALRTPTRPKTVDPEWAPFELSAQSLSGIDTDQEFLIECYAHRANGSHKFIGSCRASINKLKNHANIMLPLKNERKSRKARDGKEAPFGSLRIVKATLHRAWSFLDFVRGGMQIEFGVCVDFTASNGAVHTPQSLHFLNSQIPNQYEMAIRAVLEICEHYNHRRIFDACGFGAKIPPDFNVAHHFPLNLKSYQREVLGVQGVLDAYKSCLTNCQLYGPTNFEPSIQEFAQRARLFPRDGSRYQILLIITDGVITDMAKTKAAIVNASELPLSIIIVGVGNAEFDKMDALDSDDGLLEANGRVAKRDIVQFVPFRDYMSSSTSYLSETEREAIKSRLAKAVLEEVPDQVTSYMKSHNISARPPPQGSPRTGSIDYSSAPNAQPPIFPPLDVNMPPTASAPSPSPAPYPMSHGFSPLNPPPPSNPAFGAVH